MGIIATTVLGFTMYLFMEHIELKGLPPGNYPSIGTSVLLTFLINTTYVNDLINKVKNMFNKNR